MSNKRKTKPGSKAGKDSKSTLDVIQAMPARTSVQEVITRAESVINAYAERLTQAKAVSDRLINSLMKAQRDCTCGAVDRVLEVLPDEAQALDSSGDEPAA